MDKENLSEENLTYEEEEKMEDDAYEKALEDFSKRLIVVELPSDMSDARFTKYAKQVLGINCALALVNHEANLITPLHDDFEAPYDPITMWMIAVKNSITMSEINKEASKPDDNIYVIMSHSGRAMVCCDDFWNSVCKKLDAMRLIISMYHKEDDKTFLLVSALSDESEMDMRTYLHEANKEEESRKSYIFVRNVGMLSEAALNSEQ